VLRGACPKPQTGVGPVPGAGRFGAASKGQGARGPWGTGPGPREKTLIPGFEFEFEWQPGFAGLAPAQSCTPQAEPTARSKKCLGRNGRGGVALLSPNGFLSSCLKSRSVIGVPARGRRIGPGLWANELWAMGLRLLRLGGGLGCFTQRTNYLH
jgi:hypothetical protein